MRHGKSYRKFGRTPSHRRAMFRNLATSLLECERCQTTVGKAKDLRGVTEKLITLAEEDTLARRRQAYGYLKRKDVVHKLFSIIGPRYKDRPGGYTRVIRTGRRAGDAAELAVIELVKEDYSPKKKKKGKKTAKAKAKAPAKKASAETTSAKETPTEEAPAEKAPAEKTDDNQE